MVRTDTRTAITEIWKEGILLNPTGGETQVVDGTLSEDLAPGTLVLEDAANDQWIKADASTAAHSLGRLGVIGYKKRGRASSNALVLITDDWDVSEAEDKMTPIILSGFVSCLCDDQNAHVDAGKDMVLSVNVGACTVQSLAATGATSGTAYRATVIGTLADYIIDDDVYCILAIGAYINRFFSFDGVL